MARVLVVDDAVFMRTVLADLLSEAGHEVIAQAETGEEAVDRYVEHRPDLVTMDLVMPGAGGQAALERILHADPAALVVMVSAVGQKEDVEAALATGAKDFLVKPFDEQKVRATVQRVIESRATTEAS